MTGMTLLTDRAWSHRVSREEFEAFRDSRSHDGARYELLEGEVLVTPSPGPLHQHVIRRLMHLLEPALPAALAMLPAPVDLVLTTREGETVVQPDLLVAPWTGEISRAELGPALLVVEVLSPSTWRRDLGVKRDAYAAAGVEHYWVVSPTLPSLTVYRLGPDGGYREVTHVEGATEASVAEPVPVRIVPAELIR
ncbi:Uma2 family endonuclease [Ornithinimicrobium panacihumi]